MVLATAVPNQKAATKLKNAAQATARNGVRTRVETTVAMELAASCQPLENSNASVRKITASRRAKLVMRTLQSRLQSRWPHLHTYPRPSQSLQKSLST